MALPTLQVIMQAMADRARTLPSFTANPGARFFIDQADFTQLVITDSRLSFTTIFNRGESKSFTAVDRLIFDLVIGSSNYELARDAAMEVYASFNGLFDILSAGTDAGYNGDWVTSAPMFVPASELGVDSGHVYFCTLRSRTLVEMRP